MKSASNWAAFIVILIVFWAFIFSGDGADEGAPGQPAPVLTADPDVGLPPAADGNPAGDEAEAVRAAMRQAFFESRDEILGEARRALDEPDDWQASKARFVLEGLERYVSDGVDDPGLAALIAEARPRVARADQILELFSDVDGRHKTFAYALRQVMHDPSSLEHVRSEVVDLGDSYTVEMWFRSRNAFGATVMSRAKARFNVGVGMVEVLEEPTLVQ